MEFFKKLCKKDSKIRHQTCEMSILCSECNKIPKEDPISILEDQIKILININLSPLPIIKQSKNIYQNRISTCLCKIVYNFDVILNTKLKFDNVKKNNEDENYSPHFWNYISKYLQITSIKYIQNYCKNLNSDIEKGLTWILISLLENTLKDSFNEIFKQNFDIRYYKADSLIINEKYAIQNILDNLSKLIGSFDIKEFDIFNEYLSYKQLKQNEEKSINRMSPIKEAFKKQLYSHETISFLNNSLNYPNLIKNGFSDTKTFEQIVNIINNDQTENFNENNNLLQEEIKFCDNEVFTNIFQDNLKGHLIYYKNLHAHANRRERREKILNDEYRGRQFENNYAIVKYLDFQNCFKDNYFNFIYRSINKNKFAYSTPTNTHTAQYYSFDEKLNLKIIKKDDNLDGNITKKDIVYIKNRHAEITNSLLFYLNFFYKKVEYFRFNIQVYTNQKPITILAQNYQCQICFKFFKFCLKIPITKVHWCSYYNKFICSECVSEEYSIIPSFVINNWEFRKFKISKDAKFILDKWYDKPIIHIKNSDKLLNISTTLKLATFIKRKLHKIFDFMKCSDSFKFVNNVLGKYNYFILNENLFSLKDLYDLNSGNLILKLKEFLRVFENHLMDECIICSYKGSQCIMCLDKDLLKAYDVENVFYCTECKNTFHRKCSSVHPCLINRIEI